MNALSAATALRRSVERSGGVMRISVPALGDVFGRGRVTPRSIAAIEQVLARAGLEAQPRLGETPDDWVTLRLAEPNAEPPPAAVPAAGALSMSGVVSSRAPDAAMARGTLVAGLVGMTLGLLSSVVHALLLGVLAWTVFLAVRARGPQLRAALAPRLPQVLRAPAAVGAVAFLVPALLAAALVVGTSAPSAREAAAPEERPEVERPSEVALREGDFRLAVRLADPKDRPPLRARIARRLVADARASLPRQAYVQAIQLARRAARYGPAPGASKVIVSARAGLDLRRDRLRRQRRSGR